MGRSGRVTVKTLGRIDIPGGGQVVVAGDLAYVGHVDPPHGTSIIDVSDPMKPRLLAQVDVPDLHTHSHKVRVGNGLMLVNYESYPFDAPAVAGFQGGLKIFDVTSPSRPREIAYYRTHGIGAHRFDFDGRYVFLSTEVEGFVGNIVLILDLADPSRPREVSRWWLPGQWTAGGEQPGWQGTAFCTHHALRFGDRLYISCWQGGFAIVDIGNIARPQTILRSPSPFGFPTHTIVPLDERYVVVVDEGYNDAGEAVPAFLWIADVAAAGEPEVVGRHEIAPPYPDAPGFWGAHQPHERIIDGLAFVAWFGHGLRVIDVTDPRSPVEVGAFVPPRHANQPAVMSNDVFVDGRRRIYLADRIGGLDIMEWLR